MLLGENLGLQDILTQAGADAAAMAAQLAALEAQLERSQARVQEVHSFSLLSRFLKLPPTTQIHCIQADHACVVLETLQSAQTTFYHYFIHLL